MMLIIVRMIMAVVVFWGSNNSLVAAEHHAQVVLHSGGQLSFSYPDKSFPLFRAYQEGGSLTVANHDGTTPLPYGTRVVAKDILRRVRDLEKTVATLANAEQKIAVDNIAKELSAVRAAYEKQAEQLGAMLTGEYSLPVDAPSSREAAQLQAKIGVLEARLCTLVDRAQINDTDNPLACLTDDTTHSTTQPGNDVSLLLTRSHHGSHQQLQQVTLSQTLLLKSSDTLHITRDTVLDGRGNSLVFAAHTPQLIVADGATLYIQDIILSQVGAQSIVVEPGGRCVLGDQVTLLVYEDISFGDGEVSLLAHERPVVHVVGIGSRREVRFAMRCDIHEGSLVAQNCTLIGDFDHTILVGSSTTRLGLIVLDGNAGMRLYDTLAVPVMVSGQHNTLFFDQQAVTINDDILFDQQRFSSLAFVFKEASDRIKPVLTCNHGTIMQHSQYGAAHIRFLTDLTVVLKHVQSWIVGFHASIDGQVITLSERPLVLAHEASLYQNAVLQQSEGMALDVNSFDMLTLPAYNTAHTDLVAPPGHTVSHQELYFESDTIVGQLSGAIVIDGCQVTATGIAEYDACSITLKNGGQLAFKGTQEVVLKKIDTLHIVGNNNKIRVTENDMRCMGICTSMPDSSVTWDIAPSRQVTLHNASYDGAPSSTLMFSGGGVCSIEGKTGFLLRSDADHVAKVMLSGCTRLSTQSQAQMLFSGRGEFIVSDASSLIIRCDSAVNIGTNSDDRLHLKLTNRATVEIGDRSYSPDMVALTEQQAELSCGYGVYTITVEDASAITVYYDGCLATNMRRGKYIAGLAKYIGVTRNSRIDFCEGQWAFGRNFGTQSLQAVYDSSLQWGVEPDGIVGSGTLCFYPGTAEPLFSARYAQPQAMTQPYRSTGSSNDFMRVLICPVQLYHAVYFVTSAGEKMLYTSRGVLVPLADTVTVLDDDQATGSIRCQDGETVFSIMPDGSRKKS